jgi:sulfur dioxygenase
MATQLSSVKFFDQSFVLDGSVTPERLRELQAAGIKSVLSVAGETPGDPCFVEGFQALQDAFPAGCVAHIPIPSSPPIPPEFSGDNTNLEYPFQAVKTFRKMEDALDRLPRPTAIVCKSGRRAGAVFAAYRAVKNHLTKEQAHEHSLEHNLSYATASAGLLNWVNTVVDALAHRNPLIFRQFFESQSSTYTYLLADSVTKEAILIDPVVDTADRDAQFVRDLGLSLKYGLNTHVHADHVTGTGKLKTIFPDCQSAISAVSTAKADVHLEDYDAVTFGSRKVYAVRTPGHTTGCVSYVLDDCSAVFTGDALLIRGCGRSDFQGGSAETLYDSVHDKLFNALPDSCSVFPAHDYKGQTQSSIGEEKRLNPRLTKTKPEFVEIMNNLNLARPAQIDVAVPANLECGLYEVSKPEESKK